jgi:hypothetical protein
MIHVQFFEPGTADSPPGQFIRAISYVTSPMSLYGTIMKITKLIFTAIQTSNLKIHYSTVRNDGQTRSSR